MTSDSQLAMDEALEIRTDIQGRLGSRRRVRNGKATNDLVLSASADGNDRMFPHILGLYVNEKHVSRSSSGSLHKGAGKEAYQVLRDRGVLIVKKMLENPLCPSPGLLKSLAVTGDSESYVDPI